MNTTTTKGFTLIELLVVVAIIGILAGIIITSLSNAREKARDARRDADIKTIQTALEIYYLDHGEYPITSGTGEGTAPNDNWMNSGNDISWQTFETMVGVTLPRDPVNDTPAVVGDWAAGGNRRLNYTYWSGNSGYAGCPQGQIYFLVYRHEQGDAVGDERRGVTRCDNGDLHRYGNGAITVGMSPMM